MADSKITQLPLSPYALDKDLMVVVTGHLEEGAYPYNTKMPLSYIRRYVVRLNLISNAVSGIDTYYNSGLNILTSWTTGIHAVPGNNIEVQFESDTPASDLYGGTGPICHSGIISTTGLNAYGGNRIDIDNNSAWPYSGIINVTGLNMIDGSGIGYTIKEDWPHEYKVFSTEKVKYANSNTIISDTATTATSTTSQNILTLDYADFYQSKKNETLSLLGTISFKITNLSFGSRPYVPGTGALNSQKIAELLPISGTTYNYTYTSCDGSVCSGSHTAYQENINNTGVTFHSGELANFVSDSTFDYIANSFVLNVGISGGNTGGIISNIHSYPIVFKNNTSGSSRPYFDSNDGVTEIYRSNNNPYTVNAIDPIEIKAKVDLTINSSELTNQNSLALFTSITNVRCSRTYTNNIDIIDDQLCNGISDPYCPGYDTGTGSTSTNSYSYSTTRCYTDASATIKALFIKGENIVS